MTIPDFPVIGSGTLAAAVGLKSILNFTLLPSGIGEGESDFVPPLPENLVYCARKGMSQDNFRGRECKGLFFLRAAFKMVERVDRAWELGVIPYC